MKDTPDQYKTEGKQEMETLPSNMATLQPVGEMAMNGNGEFVCVNNEPNSLTSTKAPQSVDPMFMSFGFGGMQPPEQAAPKAPTAM